MQAAELTQRRLRKLLESDPVWNAYALADLQPPWREHTHWITGDRSAVMVFTGLSPPILFACGDPLELDRLYEQLPPGEYWFTLRPTHYARLTPRLHAHGRLRMWRMWLPAHNAEYLAEPDETVAGHQRRAGREKTEPSASAKPNERPLTAALQPQRLGARDLPAIERLYAALEQSPDAFQPAQLAHGVYFGICGEQGLLSVAGTHVLSPEIGVAAVGNIATALEQRGRGMARSVTLAVIAELRRLGIETIVLNVRMDNRPAIQLYRGLGFMPYCGFYEGRGTIRTIN